MQSCLETCSTFAKTIYKLDQTDKILVGFLGATEGRRNRNTRAGINNGVKEMLRNNNNNNDNNNKLPETGQS